MREKETKTKANCPKKTTKMPPQTKGIASGPDLGTGTSKLVRNERDKDRVRERLEERSHAEDKRC